MIPIFSKACNVGLLENGESFLKSQFFVAVCLFRAFWQIWKKENISRASTLFSWFGS